MRHLEQLAVFASAEELLSYAAAREVVAVEPQIVTEGEVARVLLPGDAGYPESA
ncbi:unannotated protein [freshwater metagenome]|uniref:Unannotated protein n=1 Tax=freshwater metagenome TaxID=449393 RepID=A0A6J7D2X5_9ZZZZ